MPVANLIKIFPFSCVQLTGEGGREVEREGEGEGRRWRGREGRSVVGGDGMRWGGREVETE